MGGRGTNKWEKILPPQAASFALSVARCASVARPTAGACTPPAHAAAAPAGAAGGEAPLTAPCSPAAGG